MCVCVFDVKDDGAGVRSIFSRPSSVDESNGNANGTERSLADIFGREPRAALESATRSPAAPRRPCRHTVLANVSPRTQHAQRRAASQFGATRRRAQIVCPSVRVSDEHARASTRRLRRYARNPPQHPCRPTEDVQHSPAAFEKTFVFPE